MLVDYKANSGQHKHELCNHCSECHEPLLTAYCNKHEPSWFVYWWRRICGAAFRIRHTFTRWEE